MARQMLLPNAPWGSQWNGALGNPYAQGIGGYLYGPRPAAFAAQDPGSFRSRIGAAIQGLGSQLDPSGGGLESFLSGATGGYTNTQDALAAGYNQRAQAEADDRATAEGEQDRGLRNAYLRAQTDYLTAGTQQRLADANDPGSDPDEVFVNNPGQPAGVFNKRTKTWTPIQNFPMRPFAPRGNGSVDPLDTKFAQILQQVRGQKQIGGILPLYDTDDKVNAEAQRRMASTYGRAPGYQAWVKRGGFTVTPDTGRAGGVDTPYSPNNPMLPK